MSPRFFFFLGLVAFLGSRPVAAQPAAAPFSGAASVSDDRHRIEQETFSLINAYRQTGHLPPLRWDFTVARIARDHSRDMATGAIGFGHAGFRDRVAQLGAVLAGLVGAGENVFESNDPDRIAQSAVAVWLKSPPHLRNIRGDYNYSGLGVWEDKAGMVYFTQIFLKLQPRAQATRAAPPVPGITTPFGLLAAPGTR